MDAGESLADLLPALFAESDKPAVAVVDSGSIYAPLVHRLRVAGVPVFRSADQAIRSLGRYLCHRIDTARPVASTPVEEPVLATTST